MSEFESFVQEFLVESYENLEQFERDLVALEENPGDHERLARAFRTVHTIKGSCGYFGFQTLGRVAHAGEELLTRLRSGQAPFNAEVVTALLALTDAVRKILATIESSGKEGEDCYEPLAARLTALYAAAVKSPEPAVPAPMKIEEPAPASPAAEAIVAEVAAAATGVSDSAPSIVDGNLRVDIGLLDRLMNLVGELVLTRNQVLQLTGLQNDRTLVNAGQRLDRITTQLQEGVMKTRMQPIGNLWNKLPRVVRDLGLACGKQVTLTIDGSETELDKSILEAIKDPLTHLVRNAVDHGIESPDERRRLGKPADGHLTLRAAHEGGQVRIEIADDGRGMDVARIRQKAVALGLMPREQAEQLAEHEALQLIFLAGLSTAEQVTAISGRGVGMDVVKAHVERVGGSVDLASQPGVGTTVTIKIPLTLAIVPALVVTVGGDRYAIPQVHLLELVRLEGEQKRRALENIHGTPVMRRRGMLLPLVHLARELEVDEQARDDVANIVVLQADGRHFGLVVDAINDTEETVVKPLGKLFKRHALYAGATIRGDGKVALILDVLGLAQRAGVVDEIRNRPAPSHAVIDGAGRCQTVLLFELGRDNRLGLPLSQVARLEKVPVRAIEKVSGREVMQYRGQILPVLRLGRPIDGASPDARVQVVVYRDRERSAALVVDRVIDIVETPLELVELSSRPGILGSAVIQNRITDLLDIAATIQLLDSEPMAGLACLAGGAA